MEDLTLAIVTLTAFVLLFVVAIFADRAGAEFELEGAASPDVRPKLIAEPVLASPMRDADVA